MSLVYALHDSMELARAVVVCVCMHWRVQTCTCHSVEKQHRKKYSFLTYSLVAHHVTQVSPLPAATVVESSDLAFDMNYTQSVSTPQSPVRDAVYVTPSAVDVEKT